MRVCWNRQTGKLEVLVFDRTCGFKSHHSHQLLQKKLNRRARVVELADSLDSGSSAHYGRAGSSPASRTKKASTPTGSVLFLRPRGTDLEPWFNPRDSKNTSRRRWIFSKSSACSERSESQSRHFFPRKVNCNRRTAIQPTTFQKFERLRDEFLADGVRPRAQARLCPALQSAVRFSLVEICFSVCYTPFNK